MEKIPSFFYDFSKKESATQRQELAQEVKRKREEYFNKKKRLEEQKKELEENIGKKEQETTEKLAKIESLKQEIENLSKSGVKKFFNYFKLKKLQAERKSEKESNKSLELEKNEDTKDLETVSEELMSKKDLEQARLMVDGFYEEEKEKWEKGEYTKEEIEKYFTEEHLSKLSLEEYALLLKRFPKEMVAHVTRQGIRDHLGHMFHNAGQGEYIDSFMHILEGKKLLSSLGACLANKEQKQAIAKFLSLDFWKTKQEALDYLHTNYGSEEGGLYTDKNAIHFATEDVADAYYGGEKGNEIFIAYPSALIASEYYFRGKLKDGGGSDYWNDQLVWTKENKGISLDAGIVFIPAEVKVDRKTGSRYEIQDGKPNKNEKLVSSLKQIIFSSEFDKFVEKFEEQNNSFKPWLHERGYSELFSKHNELALTLLKQFGITDERIAETLWRGQNIDNLKNIKGKLKIQAENKGSESEERVNETIETILKDAGLLYEEARDSVSSKEFWEDYFAKHPDKKPSKIVYYKGDDPTKALFQWRERQGIKKQADSEDLGFSEHKVFDRQPAITDQGQDRFIVLAEQVIKEYYSNEKK